MIFVKKGKTSVASEKRMQLVIIKADPCCRCCGPSWFCCNRLLHVIIMDELLCFKQVGTHSSWLSAFFQTRTVTCRQACVRQGHLRVACGLR